MGRKPLGPWVVVGADGSADASAAVELAAAEATMRGLRLRVIASCPSSTDGDQAALAARADCNRALAEAAYRTHTAWPDLTVSTLVASGDAAGTLIRESRAAGLVVVGGRGRSGRPRPGSVCAQVAAHAYCPTIVVPSDVDGPVPGFDAPVLVGVEAAGRDDAAIGFAFEEAAARDVPLRAVHVWSGVPEVGLGCVDPFAYELRTAWSAADRRLAETLAGWAEKYPQVPVEPLPLYDVNPAYALAHASANAGLVVVGASLRAPLSGQLLGTVTRTLIERAGRPVCVVRLTGR
jgi:nucleotide-binding universal stress UspA family protein